MIIGDLATYLTDGGQVLSAIFEARIRKKGVKVGKMAGKELLIRPQNDQILILVRFIGTTSPNQTIPVPASRKLTSSTVSSLSSLGAVVLSMRA